MNEKEISVMPFVNERRECKHESVVLPILAKIALFTFMVTLAMILIYNGQQLVGYLIYGKEVLELIVFICVFLKKRRRHALL